MPGLTVRLARRSTPDDAARFSAAQATMLYRPDDERVEVHGSSLCAGYVKRPAYPVRRLGHAREAPLLFEGRIYNKDWGRIERELLSLAREIDSSPAAPTEAIRQWITESDGEYVIMVAPPGQRRVVAFTDPLGRLPLYHYCDDDQLLIARECKFILQLKQPPLYDPIGCAQSMWIGYPLGERTLFRDVKRSPAAALIEGHVSGEVVRTQVRSILSLNFDEKDEGCRDARNAANSLAEEFVEVCRLRGSHPDGGANIVGLSGGHDSRAVMAGLVRAGVPCTAVTGVARGQTKLEVSGARGVATALGVEWDAVESSRPTLALHEELIRIKDGMNYTAVSNNISDMKMLLSKRGTDVTYLTGDGGDKAMPDLRPPHSVSSHAALLRELEQLHASRGLSRASAAALLGISEDELLADLDGALATYPEASNIQKAVHYAVYERGRKFVFEGEDRKRFFVWQTSPFFSFPFFRRCMRVPDRLKRDRRLYRHFLIRMSQAASEIPLTGIGVGAGHPAYLVRTWLRGRYDGLPWRVRKWVTGHTRSSAGGTRREPELAAAVRDAIEASGGLGCLVDADKLREILTQVTPTQFHYILTLALLTRLHPAP